MWVSPPLGTYDIRPGYVVAGPFVVVEVLISVIFGIHQPVYWLG